MMRHALEKGVASVVARFLLQARHDAVFAAIARADALPPEELEKLRAETLAHLEKVRDEGEPYAEAVSAAVQEVFATAKRSSPTLTTGLSTAGSLAMKTAAAAFAHAMDAGVATAATASPIPDPPAGRADVSSASGGPDEDKPAGK